jgi:hypothetical protein
MSEIQEWLNMVLDHLAHPPEESWSVKTRKSSRSKWVTVADNLTEQEARSIMRATRNEVYDCTLAVAVGR